jgi:hypothetical protein
MRRFSSRLSHLSSFDDSQHYVALSEQDEARFVPLLTRRRDVPWILEAQPRA